ncbi:MAG: LLM class F420-dependent oxidoreductase, partial [Gammaproteobacteria bacterium]|nr:LLM class F420-dependent oxidoreductase [Gammaproteobacteria bacterium]
WTFDRVADYCDGWMPIGGPGKDGIANLRAAMEKKGRDPASITLALFGAPTDPEQLTGRIEQGFTELIFGLPQSDTDKVLAVLDKHARLAESFR